MVAKVGRRADAATAAPVLYGRSFAVVGAGEAGEAGEVVGDLVVVCVCDGLVGGGWLCVVDSLARDSVAGAGEASVVGVVGAVAGAAGR